MHEAKRSRFERFLLSVMGPPQVSPDAPPPGYVPDEAAQLCHKCGRPWTEHERVHTGRQTYLNCPSATPSATKPSATT